jgi:DNA-binding MarR family transcriptional regulator
MAEPSDFRFQILRRVQVHDAAGHSAYITDQTIAEALNATIGDVQRHLLILEDEGKVEIISSFGPSYDVQLTPKGMKALETSG